MCGIAGVYQLKGDGNINPETIVKMRNSLIHRGPDDNGIYLSQDKRICLAHTRLSIIDLSPLAHQPMSNSEGTIWLVHNGEIYNYRQLQSELKKEGYRFISNSDTEVVIYGYQHWGIEGLLSRLRGMFAFAIYDARTQNPKLIIARDRFGIKPSYYFYKNDSFVFASEIKAILASKMTSEEIDPQAVALFLLYGYILPPKTIYKEISALEPGHFLIVNDDGVRKVRYYDLRDAFLDKSLANISENEAIDRVRSCLIDTIKHHLVSDVPVGAFLSGGIDSSSVVALMREVEHKPIKTVSVIFSHTAYDESRYAKLVAQRFNTEHIEVRINDRDLLEHTERIFCAMDQPTVNGVNTYFVSWATKKAGLKVAMSGVGGDEIFFGYSSFTQVPRLYTFLKILSGVPFGKKTARFVLRNANGSKGAKIYSMLSPNLSISEIYLNYRGLFTWRQTQKLFHPDFAREVMERIKPVSYLHECSRISDRFNQVSLLETTSYMANQLLRDTDIFSMAHSLEVRVPFVDHTLVELLARLPVKYKAKRDMPKRLLIKALNNRLPEEIIRRPKMGFTFPFDIWMRGELRGFIEERISSSSVFNKPYITRLVEGFYNNKVHWSRVWGLVVLSFWL